VMASMVTLAANDRLLMALGYIVLTLVLGFGAAALGFWLGTRSGSDATIEVDE